MIRRLRRAEIAGQSVVIFKQIDDRYDANDVVSHAGLGCAVPVSSVPELVARSTGFDVVGIDEVQFFEHSVVGAALSRLVIGGVRVVAAGLDQDFRRLPFGPMPELLSHAEFVEQAAGRVPPLRRTHDDDPAPRRRSTRAPYSGETVLVGAAEQYEARCAAATRPASTPRRSSPRRRYLPLGRPRHERDRERAGRDEHDPVPRRRVRVVRDREPGERRAEARSRARGRTSAHAPGNARPRSPRAPSAPRRGGSRRPSSRARR